MATAACCAFFTAISLLGSSVNEAYQILLKSAVILQMIPFTYLFLTLARTDGVPGWARAAGLVGLVTTVVGLVVAFLPTSDVEDVWFFELKLVAGVLGPLAVGWYLFQRAARAGSTASRTR